jgi:hypothetical protein
MMFLPLCIESSTKHSLETESRLNIRLQPTAGGAIMSRRD